MQLLELDGSGITGKLERKVHKIVSCVFSGSRQPFIPGRTKGICCKGELVEIGKHGQEIINKIVIQPSPSYSKIQMHSDVVHALAGTTSLEK